MPFIKLQFKPGVNRDQTDYSNEGGWYECNKVRFRSGYPEKIGGWLKSSPNAFVGVCRQMWNYTTSYSDDFLALGTNERVYIEAGGTYYDITPFGAASTTSNTIATAIGTKTITVTTTTALPTWIATGEIVQIAGAIAVGGISATYINGIQTITVTGTNTFTFTSSSPTNATLSTSISSTAYTVQFEIAPGNAIAVGGYGWGIGPWIGPSPPQTPRGWGTGNATGPVNLPQRDWWFDNFDNDLVMNIRNGPAYWWERGTTDDPANSLAAHAITLQAYAASPAGGSNDDTYVPTQVMQLLISQQDRHLLAFGCDFGSVLPNSFDPLLIRWASQDNPGQWDGLPDDSSAGDLRVSRGSRIVRALPTRQEILVWTDTHLYTLQFTATTDVFSLQEYADNISVASPRCMISAANITYWMGQDKFYAYTGRVETLPCTLRNHVFMNINFGQSDQIVCGTNEQWNEIWWFYPTINSNFNDAYVIYNHLEQIWYYGSIDRTAWLDTPLRHFPQAANTPIITDPTTGVITTGSGYVYSHEDGLNDDADAMVSYIQSSPFDIGDGDNFMLIRRIIPDVNFDTSTATNATATLTIIPRNFPGGSSQSDPADSQNVVESTLGTYTDQVFMRARARQMAFKIQSDALGVQWQLGAPRLDARQDGSR
jgi:hypothetical protein